MIELGLFRHRREKTWSRGYKTFFILNSAEHEIVPAQQLFAF